jgi:hypothetical protein
MFALFRLVTVLPVAVPNVELGVYPVGSPRLSTGEALFGLTVVLQAISFSFADRRRAAGLVRRLSLV